MFEFFEKFNRDGKYTFIKFLATGIMWKIFLKILDKVQSVILVMKMIKKFRYEKQILYGYVIKKEKH